jgi:hypothetical protein
MSRYKPTNWPLVRRRILFAVGGVVYGIVVSAVVAFVFMHRRDGVDPGIGWTEPFWAFRQITPWIAGLFGFIGGIIGVVVVRDRAGATQTVTSQEDAE